MLHELLTGHPPFEGENHVEVLTRHLSAVPPPPVSPYGSLPRALQKLVARALHKNVEGRYQTAAALAADLGHVSLSLGGWREWLRP